MSTSTSSGYVTNTAYVAEFFGDHAQPHLNLVAAKPFVKKISS